MSESAGEDGVMLSFKALRRWFYDRGLVLALVGSLAFWLIAGRALMGLLHEGGILNLGG
jgi:hypothetical protein